MTTTTPTQKEITNPTPKQRFMQHGMNIAVHRQLVDSAEYTRGIDFALLEYQSQLSQTVTDGNSAMSVGLRLRGVAEFLQTFRLLGEPTPKLGIAKVQDHLPEGN